MGNAVKGIERGVNGELGRFPARFAVQGRRR
jgi:hypothetical protein